MALVSTDCVLDASMVWWAHPDATQANPLDLEVAMFLEDENCVLPTLICPEDLLKHFPGLKERWAVRICTLTGAPAAEVRRCP